MTEPFAGNIARVHTQNFDSAVTQLRRLYGELTARTDGTFDWSADVVSLGPMMVVQGDMSSAVYLKGTTTRHALVMVRSSAMEFRSRPAVTNMASGLSGTVASPGKTIEVNVLPAVRTLNLVIEPSFLVSQLEALTGATVGEGIELASALSLGSGAGAYLYQGCQYILEKVDSSNQYLPPALVSSLCETFARTLLMSHSHNHSYLLERPVPPSSRSIVRLVEEYVDAHAGGPIVATDLARVAGTSVLSIEAAFAQHRQTTPMVFLRRRRLERARRLLLEDPLVSATRAAHLAGYLRIEPFEAAYFKLFKETAAETKRRAFVGGGSRPAGMPLEALDARLATLSKRERDVCALVAKGRLNKQIADELGISAKTVHVHRARGLQKLGIESAAELGRLWERLGK